MHSQLLGFMNIEISVLVLIRRLAQNTILLEQANQSLQNQAVPVHIQQPDESSLQEAHHVEEFAQGRHQVERSDHLDAWAHNQVGEGDHAEDCVGEEEHQLVYLAD